MEISWVEGHPWQAGFWCWMRSHRFQSLSKWGGTASNIANLAKVGDVLGDEIRWMEEREGRKMTEVSTSELGKARHPMLDAEREQKTIEFILWSRCPFSQDLFRVEEAGWSRRSAPATKTIKNRLRSCLQFFRSGKSFRGARAQSLLTMGFC